MEYPSFDDYTAAIAEHGERPITVEMTVVELTMLISALQLALRHPEFPESVRPYVEPFIWGAIEGLLGRSPVIAVVMIAGMPTTHDEGGLD